MAGSAEWMTPGYVVTMARDVLGKIDLDPASSAFAQKVIRAERYYTKKDDGLLQEWSGRVWLNPPYSRGLIDRFVTKILASPNVTASLVLVNSATETHWAQELMCGATWVFFFNHRIHFMPPPGVERPDRPKYPQMLVYRGPQLLRMPSSMNGEGILLS